LRAPPEQIFLWTRTTSFGQQNSGKSKPTVVDLLFPGVRLI
jgi:hypothetical protein